MDFVTKAYAYNGTVRIYVATSTELVGEAIKRHHLWPTSAAALGRTLTIGAIMGLTYKGDEELMIRLNGGGPIGDIVVRADAMGNVRGYVYNPNVPLVEKHPGKLDVGATVGAGTLTVIRDLQMKEPYVGSIQLISGEIGDDVTAYFVQSEQIPTACALGVLVDRDTSVKVAGGYLIQLLPGATEETITAVEKGIQRAGAVTAMLEQGMTPEDILGQVLGDLGVVFMETTEVAYKCYCSRERVTAALISLGKKELTEIMEEGKPFPVECQFCDEIYTFTPEDIESILKKV